MRTAMSNYCLCTTLFWGGDMFSEEVSYNPMRGGPLGGMTVKQLFQIRLGNITWLSNTSFDIVISFLHPFFHGVYGIKTVDDKTQPGTCNLN